MTKQRVKHALIHSMHAVHPLGYKDLHSPLLPSFHWRAARNCPHCFCRHRPWVLATGLRFTLWVMNHSIRGHQFHYMVATCHAQHLCNKKGTDNLKDPGPMFWLPAHPEVCICTTTTVEADKIKQIQVYGIHLVNSYIHEPILFSC